MKIYVTLLPKTFLYYAKLYFTTQILLREKYIFLPKIELKFTVISFIFLF